MAAQFATPDPGTTRRVPTLVPSRRGARPGRSDSGSRSGLGLAVVQVSRRQVDGVQQGKIRIAVDLDHVGPRLFHHWCAGYHQSIDVWQQGKGVWTVRPRRARGCGPTRCAATHLRRCTRRCRRDFPATLIPPDRGWDHRSAGRRPAACQRSGHRSKTARKSLAVVSAAPANTSR